MCELRNAHLERDRPTAWYNGGKTSQSNQQRRKISCSCRHLPTAWANGLQRLTAETNSGLVNSRNCQRPVTQREAETHAEATMLRTTITTGQRPGTTVVNGQTYRVQPRVGQLQSCPTVHFAEIYRISSRGCHQEIKTKSWETQVGRYCEFFLSTRLGRAGAPFLDSSCLKLV